MGTFLQNRWDIDYNDRRIFRDEAVDSDPKILANTNTVNELYSALQDLFDEPSQMDDLVPMSAQTPTEYSMINGWFIDPRSTEFLKGGAIQSVGWAGGEIRAISYDGTGAGTAFAPTDIGLPIVGTTTTDSGTILWYDERFGTELGVVYIRPDVPATDLFDNGTEAYTVTGGAGAGNFTTTLSTASITGETLWANPFTLGSIVSNTDLYFYQNEARVVSKAVAATALQWWGTGQVDILLQVRELGSVLDNGFVTVFARQGTTQYDFFQSDLSGGGRQPLPLAAAPDLNDAVGFRQMVLTTGAGAFLVGEVITDDSDDSIKGIVTSVAGTNPNITLQYYLIGDPLNDFTGATGTFSSEGTGTGTAVAPTNVNGALAAGITVAMSLTTEDINNGSGPVPYSVRINPNSVVLQTVYQRLKYLTRRGETANIDAVNYLVPGEAFKGVEARLDFNTQTGTFVQGELVYDTTTGAVGRVVAVDNTADYVMLGQVKGTFTAGNIVGDAATGPTDFATIVTAEVITPVKANPFGQFAGGVLFGARGVTVTSANLNSADVQNYQLIDNDGQVQIPPNVISVAVQTILARTEGTHTGAINQPTTLTDSAALFQTSEADNDIKVGSLVINVTDGSSGTIVSIDSETQITTTTLTGGTDNDFDTNDEYAITDGDRVLVARVDGSSDIIRNELTSSTGNNAGAVEFVANATLPSDIPDAGIVRVVDISAGEEHRYRYASKAGSTLTFVLPTDGQGNPTANDATNGAIEMTDNTADFAGAAIPVRVGDQIRNATDGGIGAITKVFNDKVEHTPLTGGTNNDWQTTDTYEINRLVVTYINGTDTAYIPIVDGDNITEGTTELSNSLVFNSNFDVTIRVRQGKVILPFITAGTVTSGGLTVSAIRTQDTIAT